MIQLDCAIRLSFSSFFPISPAIFKAVSSHCHFEAKLTREKISEKFVTQMT